jgi:hypothetical protein
MGSAQPRSLASTRGSVRGFRRPGSKGPKPGCKGPNPVASGPRMVPARSRYGRSGPGFVPARRRRLPRERSSSRTLMRCVSKRRVAPGGVSRRVRERQRFASASTAPIPLIFLLSIFFRSLASGIRVEMTGPLMRDQNNRGGRGGAFHDPELAHGVQADGPRIRSITRSSKHGSRNTTGRSE